MVVCVSYGKGDMNASGTYGVRLADGTEYTATATKLPKHWKSRAMELAPYGTSFQGCEFFKRHATIEEAIRSDERLAPLAAYLLDQHDPS